MKMNLMMSNCPGQRHAVVPPGNAGRDEIAGADAGGGDGESRSQASQPGEEGGSVVHSPVLSSTRSFSLASSCAAAGFHNPMRIFFSTVSLG